MWRRLTTLLLLLLVTTVYASLNGCSKATVSPTIETPTLESTAITTENTTAVPTDVQVDIYAEARNRLVEQGIIGYGIDDPLVIDAMRRTPRHLFVPEDYLDMAYENHPLPIGYGQTISQPYIVALMTQELGVGEGDRVLEIGTGSGYQAAVLAELGVEVYTIEIIGPLAEAASERLERLGYENVHVRHADGYFGWEEEAPFDAVIVTAAPGHVPQPLKFQLKIGGIMVIPVGPVGGYQELWRVMRVDEDKFDSISLGGVRFVPFTREIEDD
ncbi:MAG: protein-L-isoaspartate(D-aspartate) O-methyltransferase [Anaerolineales bacterium]